MSAATVSTTTNAGARTPRTRSARRITVADVRAEARSVVRGRWPRLDAEYVAWRTAARYTREVDAGRRPDDLTVWMRSAVYELVVDDQRADHGQTAYAAELDTLLHELSQPRIQLLDPGLLARAVVHLHPRDVIILRLLLAGYPRSSVARRMGVSDGAVDLAYGRVRARLRATIASDQPLCQALRQVHDIARPQHRDLSRPTRRARFTRLGRPLPPVVDVA